MPGKRGEPDPKMKKLLRERGWEWEKTKSGHIRYRPKDGGRPVIGAGTPGRGRADRNLRADLRRRGLEDRQPKRGRKKNDG